MASPFRVSSPPPIKAPDHAGNARPDGVYWTAPPPRIGLLLSAWSNQNSDGFETDRSVRALIILCSILAIGAVAVAVALYDWAGPLAVAGFVAAVVAFVIFAVHESKSRPWCNYIGEEGFSEHKITWRKTTHDIVRFDAVAGLWVTRTEHTTNGVYQHTVEEYEWRNKAGLTLLKRSELLYERGAAAAGARFGSGGKTQRKPTREWMSAAAERWKHRRAAAALANLDEHGVATFPADRGGFFSIRPGEIELSTGGKSIVLKRSDSFKVKLDAGVLSLKAADGKLRFSISSIADHDLAFALAADVGGIDLLDLLDLLD